jgi:hypothetical protein
MDFQSQLLLDEFEYHFGAGVLEGFRFFAVLRYD